MKTCKPKLGSIGLKMRWVPLLLAACVVRTQDTAEKRLLHASRLPCWDPAAGMTWFQCCNHLGTFVRWFEGAFGFGDAIHAEEVRGDEACWAGPYSYWSCCALDVDEDYELYKTVFVPHRLGSLQLVVVQFGIVRRVAEQMAPEKLAKRDLGCK